MSLLDKIIASEFLGEEFLYWLWYMTYEYEGTVPLSGGDYVTICFSGSMTFSDMFSKEIVKLTGGSPYSPAAKTAARSGKRLTEAKFYVVSETREYEFVFRSRPFAFSSVKIPAVLSKEYDDKAAERIYLLQEFESIFDTLYNAFIAERVFGDWANTLDSIREWVQS